jgi:hypothetical protein
MNPNSDMSPAALTVMAVVVVVLIGGWLGAVFFAARQPRTRAGRQRKDDAAGAAEPDAVTPRGDVPAGPHAHRSAQQPADAGTKEPVPRGAVQSG